MVKLVQPVFGRCHFGRRILKTRSQWVFAIEVANALLPYKLIDLIAFAWWKTFIYVLYTKTVKTNLHVILDLLS